MNKATSGEKLWRIATVFLMIVLALNLMIFFSQIKHHSSRGYAYEYSEFSRAVQKKDYPRLVDAVVNNDTRGLKAQKDTSQFSLLAEYYHAAMLRHAFAVNGDNAAAEGQQQIMESLKSAMTDSEILTAADEIQNYYS